MNKHYQQGDLILIPVASIPNGKKVKDIKGILAEGEHTGHAHCVAEPETVDLRAYDVDGVTYISLGDVSTVTHQEHRPIQVPAGNYEIRRTLEYDHFAEEARRVSD